MLCPRCQYTLVEAKVQIGGAGSVGVDACARCHGAFYEHQEAVRGLDPDVEMKKLVAAGSAKMRSRSALPCPHGHGNLVTYRCEAPGELRQSVDVDVCVTCKGLWLDRDEARVLQVIADQSGDVRHGLGWYLLQVVSGLPLEVYHPVKRRPVVVWLLIVTCVLAFGWELVLAAQDRLALLIQQFGLVPHEVVRGRQLWSIVTHMFLHGGFGHIFGNMAYLYIFGDNIEDRIGRKKFLLLYLACGLAAGAAQVLAGVHSSAPCVGASGAIAGIMGAYLVLFPRVRIFFMVAVIRFKVSIWLYLGVWILMNLFMGSVAVLDGASAGGGVAWWAHIGGFAAGALWALVMRRRILAAPG